MSSNYHVLCMNHDPAIVIDGGWYSSDDAFAAIKESHERLAPHQGCDLLVGRYSYPLVQVCCPGGSHVGMMHVRPEWVDASWLRLLAAAYESKDPRVLAAAQHMPCWTSDRVNRLRVELGT